MIKENKKSKKKKDVTFAQEMLGYLKTAGISFIAATIFTVLLSFHARSEMIKNLYANKNEKTKIEQQLAIQIVSNADLTAKISDKNYSFCMKVGNLYELAGDYLKAEYAYYNAYKKSPTGIYDDELKLVTVLILQNKIDEAKKIINSVTDTNTLRLIRFKTRANIIVGDYYYTNGKFLKAADAYEKAYYYYNRLTKKDKIIKESIRQRVINAYLEASYIIIKNGYNTDAVRFLKKALKYDPDNLKILYRLAIVYADLDPVVAFEYFEPLINKIPHEIDYSVYTKSLMKAANIMDIEGDGIKAKYYRYKVHSFDLFAGRKIVYKEDIELEPKDIKIKKKFFTYRINSEFSLKNVSSQDISNLSAEFILRHGGDEKKIRTIICARPKEPLFSNGEALSLKIKFGDKIFTKKELKKYSIDIYLYKDPKYKTLISSYKILPNENYVSKTFVSPHL